MPVFVNLPRIELSFWGCSGGGYGPDLQSASVPLMSSLSLTLDSATVVFGTCEGVEVRGVDSSSDWGAWNDADYFRRRGKP